MSVFLKKQKEKTAIFLKLKREPVGDGSLFLVIKK